MLICGVLAKKLRRPRVEAAVLWRGVGCSVRIWLAANLIYMKSRGEASREDYVVKIRSTRRIARNGGHMRRVRGITCLVFVQSRQLPRPQLLTAPLHRLFPRNCDQIPNTCLGGR
jgi:hypothetical protein